MNTLAQNLIALKKARAVLLLLLGFDAGVVMLTAVVHVPVMGFLAFIFTLAMLPILGYVGVLRKRIKAQKLEQGK